MVSIQNTSGQSDITFKNYFIYILINLSCFKVNIKVKCLQAKSI